MWRVSTVLAEAGLKPPLKISPDVLAEGYARGRRLHAVFEERARHDDYVAYHPDDSGYAIGIFEWFARYDPRILFVERRFVDRRARLTGRADLGCVMPDGFPYIVDLKRSGEAAWHAVQTAGYAGLADADPEMRALVRALADERHDADHAWRRANLYLPGDGRFRWVARSDGRDDYLFRSALALVQWRYNHGLLARTDREHPDDDRQREGAGWSTTGPGAGVDDYLP